MLLAICALLALPGFLLVLAFQDCRYLSKGFEAPAIVPAEDRRLIIVLPANAPDINLCKATTSAISLGYPAPVIVNWGKDYQGKGWHGGSHLDKIIGTLDFLNWASSSDAGDHKLGDNDLVIVLDSYDTWFQLPPSVLLQRYHEANRLAGQRLEEQWPGQGNISVQQSIIVSAQKKCFPPPDSGSILHCDALPESPARADLYGPETDKDPNLYHNVRPRYLNSGSMIGPVEDMRRYFDRVKHRMRQRQAEGVHLYSDQGIFAEVFGEQEIMRQRLRDGHVQDQASEIETFEYHVGLDYTQQLFIATVFEEEDGDIITLGNETEIARRSKALQISPVRLKGVPNDLANTQNPLQSMGAGDYSWWDEMPLYADFFSTAIPVVLHHNAHKDGLKSRRVEWWDRTWYFPYLRELLAAQLSPGEREPLFRSADKVVYWAPQSNQTGAKPRLFKEHLTSPAQEGSEANTMTLPTFNLIIPSLPNAPLQLDASYLESVGLLNEPYSQEQSHCDLTWQPDPCCQDGEPLLANTQRI
ncbi:hypothetical protein CEP54_015226 [Fusarium duplospermum]|uniref:Uncharacterized protein n=1 Tax=Fusarium duplospermum TaxID=1325734 RepID=A0A428NQQ1_9HYPO|nr:hypothetical protein CEP54_015226 [Fusarium duplospermum]